MDRVEVIETLSQLNPYAKTDEIHIYADAFLSYREAAENITKCGNIVAHPRTGAPMENPYLKVRASSIAIIQKCKNIKKTGEIWTT